MRRAHGNQRCIRFTFGARVLGEERSLLSHCDVHKVAKESAVLDRAGKGCLGRFRSSAIAHHSSTALRQGLEPGSENVGAPRDW